MGWGGSSERASDRGVDRASFGLQRRDRNPATRNQTGTDTPGALTDMDPLLGEPLHTARCGPERPRAPGASQALFRSDPIPKVCP